MWTHTARSCGRRFRPLRHNVRFTRRYHGQQEHTTYFQQPPPQPSSRGRKIFRTTLWSTTCFALGAYAYSWIFSLPFDFEEISEEQAVEMAHDAMVAGTSDIAAREAPPMTLAAATELLQARSGYSVTPVTVAHTGQLPSNLPCEDTWSCGAFTFFHDQKKDWHEWAIFDGHAGPRTAQLLKQFLPSIVGGELWEAKCMDQPYVPNDWHTVSTIKKAFQQIDKDIVEEAGKRIEAGGPMAEVIAAGAAAFSGSCALLALYDPVRNVLRVANVGDSRAVLGRWDAQSGKYVAQPLSVDQTGFNQDEVARTEREHPGENVIDPKTGRVHGLAVSRAFGDARWKWTKSLTQLAHEKFFGPSPRPKDVIQTPPYLTAEPEVMETKVQNGPHPDFLIMASDGLWDQMSSEDAVTCVNEWLKKNKPTNFLEDVKQSTLGSIFRSPLSRSPHLPTFSSSSDVAGNEEDIYYDEDEKCLKWKTSPKHFVVEDENCGNHLIKNALGGKRRNLFTGVVTVQPPLSRYVRDDITVHVIFFGQDTEPKIKNA